MNELRQATDEEVADWTTAKYAEDYGDDIQITNLEDVDVLVGEAAGLVHEHGAAHLITQIAVWPVLAEAEALITLDLPAGIRLCTLCISQKHVIPDGSQAGDGRAVVRQVLGNVLSAARALAGEYETEVSRRAHEAGQPARQTESQASAHTRQRAAGSGHAAGHSEAPSENHDGAAR